jgi:hypothetical protein
MAQKQSIASSFFSSPPRFFFSGSHIAYPLFHLFLLRTLFLLPFVNHNLVCHAYLPHTVMYIFVTTNKIACVNLVQGAFKSDEVVIANVQCSRCQTRCRGRKKNNEITMGGEIYELTSL